MPVARRPQNHHNPNGNGKPAAAAPPIPPEGNDQSLLAAKIAALSGTDQVAIGSASPSPEEIQGATMEDAAKLGAGIKYLVKGWIPFGMVTGIVAEPGVGKSAFALWLARSVMTGRDWFNGTRGPAPGYVLWCPTENDLAITRQRMLDWQIPMDRLILPFKDDPLSSVNLTYPAHLERIEALVNKYRTPLVVIDSLRGAHAGDENNSCVGAVLQQLASIAERTKAAFAVVHHTRKLMDGEEITANSSRGSNAILALMRSQLGIDRPDPNGKQCRLRVLKENLGLAPAPIGFEVTSTGLVFGKPPAKPQKETEKDRAEAWIKAHLLAGEWYKAGDLIDEAGQDGISETALKRARNDLGIVKPNYLRKTKDGWEWRLPGKAAGENRAPLPSCPLDFLEPPPRGQEGKKSRGQEITENLGPLEDVDGEGGGQ
jgi:hypothetical protein